MKRLIISIIFIIVVLFVVIYITNIYNKKDTVSVTTNDFNKEINNIDLIFLGSSRVGVSCYPAYIFEKYGVPSYVLASSSQNYKTTLLLLKKYKPKYAVIDYSVLRNDYLYWKRTELNIFYTVFEKFNAAKFLFGDNYKRELNTLSKYHTRWKELKEYDFHKGKKFDYSKGSWIHPILFNISPYVQTREKLSNKIEEYIIPRINEFINVANKYGVKLFFLITPAVVHVSSEQTFEKYAKENNIDFINYNNPELMESLNINYKDDMADNVHLNMYGSYKMMDHLIPYLQEKYDLKDERNNPKYESWHEDYLKFKHALNQIEIRAQGQRIKWMRLSQYDNYTVLLSANGDVLRKLPEQLKNDLKSFGLKKYNTDKPNIRYAAIIDDNKVFFEEISNNPVTYKGRMKNLVNLLVTSDGKATINVSGKPRSKNKYGLNFVIYDKVNKEIVDSIWIDPAKPDAVRR